MMGGGPGGRARSRLERLASGGMQMTLFEVTRRTAGTQTCHSNQCR